MEYRRALHGEGQIHIDDTKLDSLGLTLPVIPSNHRMMMGIDDSSPQI